MRFLSLLLWTCLGMTITFSAQTATSDLKSASGELVEKCVYPEQPTIPNASKATEEELVAAQKKMQAYLTAGNEFIACLEKNETTWSKEEAKEKRPIAIMFHNKIVDDMNDVADLFNTAVRAFKGKQ